MVQTVGMSMLTIAELDQKIRTAQEGLDHADDVYDRNVYAQIGAEYKAYRAARIAREVTDAAAGNADVPTP
jgi:2-phospho-L-lactate transferase/gluconeogenesis factor (CofD/UPF0052 family)